MKGDGLPYRDGACIAAFVADLRRRPRRLCLHLRSQPEQLSFRFMAFPGEVRCRRCMLSDLRNELIRCHCCGAELEDQMAAVVLVKHTRFLRAFASLCATCRGWLPPGVRPLRLMPLT